MQDEAAACRRTNIFPLAQQQQVATGATAAKQNNASMAASWEKTSVTDLRTIDVKEMPQPRASPWFLEDVVIRDQEQNHYLW